MLRSFRLGNHRSFRDEQELLLMPVYAKGEDALPVAAVYGANASGKSNLLDGLRFMAEAVRDSFGQWRPDDGVPRRPFKLDQSASEEPSVFVVDLVDGGVRYTYGFELDDVRVRSEWLYSYPEKRKRVIFERELDDIKFGSTVAELRGKLEVLEGLLRPNALFLGLAAQANLGPLLPVYRWITAKLVFRLDPASRPQEREITDFLLFSPQSSEQLVDLLRVADLGITGIAVGDEMFQGALSDRLAVMEAARADAARVVVKINQALESVVQEIDEIDQRSSGVAVSLLARRDRLQDELDQSVKAYHNVTKSLREFEHRAAEARGRVRLTHGTRGELFEMAEESAGTLSWLGLLPAVLQVIRDGGTLIIDEIDASLHPRLTARLVALCRDAATNLNSAQLIFTTHDASLLSPVLGEEVLKRDEIWFVEKGRGGASKLYPLTDFHPRKEGENLERRYLGGSYGAVPNVLEEDFVRVMTPSGGADGSA